jgi:preprotein translocase subunit SecD
MTLLATRSFFNRGSRFSGLSRETLGIDESPSHTLAGGRI